MKVKTDKTNQAADNNQPGNKTRNEPGTQVVNLGAETVEAIADAIAEKLVQTAFADGIVERICQTLMPLLLIHARLCAADTVRTTERSDTVFRHAIKEAEIARAEIEKHFQATNT